MKILLGLIVVLVILGVGYAIVSSVAPAPQPVVTGENVIPNDTPTQNNDAAIDDSAKRVEAPQIGLAFSYPEGNEGYVLSPITETIETDPNFAMGYLLTRSEDARNAGENMEGPPTISIRAFTNTKKQFALPWAMEHTLASNYNLKLGEPTEEVVGGANAIRYRADGLYATDTVIITHGSHVYIVTGGFLDENDQIHTDYEQILNSIEFIPEV